MGQDGTRPRHGQRPRSPPPTSRPSARPQEAESSKAGPSPKRIRLDPPPATTTTPSPPTLPSIPSLYHLALSAHHASSTHLQQVLIPNDIHSTPSNGEQPILALVETYHSTPFRTDPLAYDKALGLLLLSLDLLKSGIDSRELSDVERISFGLEFGLVAVKVISALSSKQSGKAKQPTVDLDRLWTDSQDAVGDSLALARKYSYLYSSLLQLELLDARLLFMQKKAKAARRAIRNALSVTSLANSAHRYSLILLALEFADLLSPTESFNFLDQLQSESESQAHVQVLQLSKLIRMQMLFQHRQWADIPSALDSLVVDVESEALVGDRGWQLHLQIHSVLYQALWAGRAGNDDAARSLLKKVYGLADQVQESGVFASLRAQGGLLKVSLPDGKHLLVQATPPNITYLMTYLVTVVSRRDYLGSSASCKSLVLPRSLRAHENEARADDMWDCGFSPTHGISDALRLRYNVHCVRIEVMLEEATALMFRGDNIQANIVFQTALQTAIDNGVFQPLAPHFCLVRAQQSHLLGRDQAALRSYQACLALLVPGSEMGLLVEICLLACNGGLIGLLDDSAKASVVKTLTERCRSSSSAIVLASGFFLASLLEPNRVASKKRLATAYGLAKNANNNILRCIIFAFTTSVHLYGTSDQTLRQMVTGRDLARLMGGKDRTDGIGQLAHGLWFAVKLREWYRREANAHDYALAKADQARHLVRLEQQKTEVLTIPPNI